MSVGDVYMSVGDVYMSVGDVYMSVGNVYMSVGDVMIRVRVSVHTEGIVIRNSRGNVIVVVHKFRQYYYAILYATYIKGIEELFQYIIFFHLT